MPKLLSPKEAAGLSGLTEQLITYYCRHGVFPSAFKFRGTRWKIPKREVLMLIDGKLDASQR